MLKFALLASVDITINQSVFVTATISNQEFLRSPSFTEMMMIAMKLGIIDNEGWNI